jgi:hypothetical protein
VNEAVAAAPVLRDRATLNPIAPWTWAARLRGGGGLQQYDHDGYHSPRELVPAEVEALHFAAPTGGYTWAVPTGHGPLVALGIHVDRQAQLTGAGRPMVATARIRAEYTFAPGILVLRLTPRGVAGMTWHPQAGAAVEVVP